MTLCPGQDTVTAYVDQLLPADYIAAIDEHLGECDGCRRRLARATPSGDSIGDEPTMLSWDHPIDLEAGARVGRLLVLRKLADGGIGSVALAYDPELDRRVALKVLRPEVWRLVGDEAREKLTREAMVMARLAHPNIVTVYDVGSWCDQAYIAMEFVDGPTLLEWTEATARSWREVLDVCLAAGRGIAAAHASGIVHRDVKPANVLLGRDGWVRVTDFGVAALLDEVRGAAGSEELVSGTPGYMSPEQMEGRPVDQRSDQFGFCVTVWEAFCGRLPFQGETLPAIWNAVRTGRVVPPPPGRMPGAIRRVLLRGLHPNPAERYASMDDLLGCLAYTPRRRRRMFAAAGLAAGLAAASAIGALAGRTESSGTCAAAATHLNGVWDLERRAAVKDVFLGASLSDPMVAFDRFAGVVDQRTSRWVASRTEACRATRITGEQSEAVLDARMACLDDQLRAFDSLVSTVTGEGGSAFRALEAVHDLPDAEACTAAAVRSRGTPASFAGDATATAQADAVDRFLARARVAISMVDLDAARAALNAAEAASAELPDEVRAARILFERARVAELAHQFDEAAAAFTAAGQAAARGGADRMVAETAARMVLVVGVHQQRPAAAPAWDAAAELQLARGVGDDSLRGFLEEARGRIALQAHDLDLAGKRATRALELYRAAIGGNGPAVLGALRLQAGVLDAGGDHAGALRLYREALAIAEAAYGPEHPHVANALTLIARWSADGGDLAAARTGFERALAIRERAFGADHPLVAESLGDLGIIAAEQGDSAIAESNMRRWLAAEEKLDPQGPNLAAPLINLGVVLREGGRHAEARPLIERAVTIYEQARGGDFVGLVAPLIELATLELETRGCHAADPILTRALRIAADDPTASYALIPLAGCEVEAGRPERALELARRAASIREAANMPARLLAEARFAEACALFATGHKGDARKLVDLARRDASPKLTVQIDEWVKLSERQRRRL